MGFGRDASPRGEAAPRSRTPRRDGRASTLPRASKENGAESDPRIRVVVRKRPLDGEAGVLEVSGSDMVVHEPKLKLDLTKFVDRQRFTFDQAFGEGHTNHELYSACVAPLVNAAFQGARCTCLAYGQTGSGKTFTMLGSRLQQGMLGFSCDEMFSLLPSSGGLSVTVSAYEIYCGRLYDLLNGRQVLCARENAKQQVVIVGLRELPVSTREHLLQVIENGLASRKTGVTGGNADSSRSHMIVQITLLKQGSEHGKLTFVDLAGSERGADVGDSCKQTRMDGAEINKSLLALKECIRAMDQQKEHQPFRGSKLTQVLKDSFVGDTCRTLMIATVCPTARNVEHTLNTLRYAWRVRELRSEERKDRPALRPLEEAEAIERREPPRRLAWNGGDENKDAADCVSSDSGASRPRACDEPAESRPRSEGRTELPARADEARKELRDARLLRPPRPDLRATSKSPIPAKEERSAREEADELARRHAELTEKIVEEEEELIASHRSHIDEMVNGLKSQMEALNVVDQPGSDVEEYNHHLLNALAAEEGEILALRKKLRAFRLALQEERLLSERARTVGLH